MAKTERRSACCCCCLLACLSARFKGRGCSNISLSLSLSLSLWDGTDHANTESFQGSDPLLPHLCPLSVPKVGRGMWGTFGKPLKRAIWNTPSLHAADNMCEILVRF